MVRLFLFSFCLFLSSSVFAQWSMNSIPESLLQNSNVVIRRYATDVKFFNADKIVVAENIVFTILEEDESNRFYFQSIIGSMLKNEMLEGKVYDENGKRLKSVNVHLDDGDTSSRGSTIHLMHNSTSINYPLTIEVEYRKSLKSLDDIQSWIPIMRCNVSLQNASLRLTEIDSSFVGIKYDRIPLPNKFVDEDGYCVYLWELTDFLAIKKGNSQELPFNDLPSVRFSRIK